MYTAPSKKTLILNILNVLKKYSDEEHRLSQADIIAYLEKDYQMKAERKAIKTNLLNLVDLGYSIECEERTRRKQNGEEEVLCEGWRYVSDFSDAELRLLIDSILSSKHIPAKQCQQLIKKLGGLSNVYFKTGAQHICNFSEIMPENKQLFYNIEVLDEAISKKLKVSFVYNEFGTDKKLHPRLWQDGQPRIYHISPYRMAAVSGRYYLLCNNDKFDDIGHYRVDFISDIKLLETAAVPQKFVKGAANGLNMSKLIAEHIYMFTGESIKVQFSADKSMVGEIVDWFGKGVKFVSEKNGEVIADVVVNPTAMKCWALQYAPYVKVISPPELVLSITNDLQTALDKYKVKK